LGLWKVAWWSEWRNPGDLEMVAILVAVVLGLTVVSE
jgi:hypothetical protein